MLRGVMSQVASSAAAKLRRRLVSGLGWSLVRLVDCQFVRCGYGIGPLLSSAAYAWPKSSSESP